LKGTDGIVPALLQQEVSLLMTHLCHIFRAYLAKEYIPKAWRQVKVTIIPKHRKANYTAAKTYRAIRLHVENDAKFVDRHIREEIWGLRPLHRYQFA
jgi:predicted methyltransferase